MDDIFPNLGTLNVQADFLKKILIPAFLLFLIIYLIVSFALFYHWQEYGMGHKKIYVYGIIFFVVSILAFGLGFLLLHKI